MITQVNEKFFQTDSSTVENPKKPNAKPMNQTKFMTYQKILEKKVKEDGTEELTYRAPRLLATVLTPTEEYNNYQLEISKPKPKQPLIIKEKRTGAEYQYQAPPIFMIAYPYNGFLKPFKESMQYRIYHGYTCMSGHYNIKLNKKKLNRLLYLTIVPNVSLFADEHKYHVDSIKIPFTSYVTRYEDGKPKMFVATTMTVEIASDLSYTTTWTTEELDINGVDVEEIRKTPLFVQYQPKVPEKKPGANKKQFNKNTKGNSSFNKNQKVGKPQGDRTAKTKYTKPTVSTSKKSEAPKSNICKSPASGKPAYTPQKPKQYDNNSGSKNSRYNSSENSAGILNTPSTGTKLDSMIAKAFSDSKSKDLKKKMSNNGKGGKKRR